MSAICNLCQPASGKHGNEEGWGFLNDGTIRLPTPAKKAVKLTERPYCLVKEALFPIVVVRRGLSGILTQLRRLPRGSLFFFKKRICTLSWDFTGTLIDGWRIA